MGSEGLTIEKIKRALADARELSDRAQFGRPPWRSRDNLFEGLPVYVVRGPWPKVQRGTRKVRFPAHPLILWIARRVARARHPWFDHRAPWWTYQEIEVANFVDRDPLIIDGAVHCSPAQWEILKNQFRTDR